MGRNAGQAKNRQEETQADPSVPPLPEELLESGIPGALEVQADDGDGADVGSGAAGPEAAKSATNEERIQDSAQVSIKEMIADAIAQVQAQFQAELAIMKTSMVARLDELSSIARALDNGLSAQMVGGIFNCPECGLRITGPSTTSMKGSLYEHPFDESPQLGGKKCRLIGKKFKSPVVFLEFAPAKPSSPAAPREALTR